MELSELIVPLLLEIGTLFILIAPFVSVLWFLTSMILFIVCPKDSVEKKKSRKKKMIVSGIVTVVLVSAFIGLLVAFSRAMEHM